MNKKGFTLLEMMIVVAIISILSTVGMSSIRNRGQKNALISMTTQIPIFLENLRDESFETGKRYYLKFRLDENKIYVLKNKTDELKDSIKELNLSKYFIYEDNSENKQFSVETTQTGNFTKNFCLIIFDKKREKLLKRISIYISTSKINYAMINEYNPKTTITLDNYKDRNNWKKKK